MTMSESDSGTSDMVAQRVAGRHRVAQGDEGDAAGKMETQMETNEEIYYAGLAGPGSQMIGEEEEKELLDVVRSKVLARDRFENVRKHYKVRTFEDRFRQYMGADHALAVVNATQGLVISLKALGIGPGDEVIVPAYTFIATAAAVVAANAIPVLAEIDESLNMDPDDVATKITERTKCVLPVHMKGASPDMERLAIVTRKHGLKMVEDVAQACGASYKGKKLGAFGDAGVFSFDYWKVITTGGGGMILTSDDDVYKKSVHYHDHGHELYRENEDLGERPVIGLNFRMEELEGAMGLAQLAKLDAIVATMRRNAARLWDGIKNIGPFVRRRIPDPDGDIGNGVTLIWNSASNAETFFKEMSRRRIEVEWLKESGWHNYANWKQLLKKKTTTATGCPFTCPFYKGQVEYREGMCPRTDDLLARSVTICYNRLLRIDDQEMERTIRAVHDIVNIMAR